MLQLSEANEIQKKSNAFNIKKTTIGTSATKIEFPESGNDFLIYHVTAMTNVWLGKSGVSVGGSDSAPLPPEILLPLKVFSGNGNNMYGVVNSGSVDIYVVGAVKE